MQGRETGASEEKESGKNHRCVGEKGGEKGNREEEETNLSRRLGGNETVRMGWCRWGGGGGTEMAVAAEQGRWWRRRSQRQRGNVGNCGWSKGRRRHVVVRRRQQLRRW